MKTHSLFITRLHMALYLFKMIDLRSPFSIIGSGIQITRIYGREKKLLNWYAIFYKLSLRILIVTENLLHVSKSWWKTARTPFNIHCCPGVFFILFKLLKKAKPGSHADVFIVYNVRSWQHNLLTPVLTSSSYHGVVNYTMADSSGRKYSLIMHQLCALQIVWGSVT